MIQYKINIEGEFIIMTYDEIIKTIMLGYEYKIIIPKDNMEIGILSKQDKLFICYVSTINNKRKHIVDICINKQEIETYKLYEYKTIATLLKDNNVIIEYL